MLYSALCRTFCHRHVRKDLYSGTWQNRRADEVSAFIVRDERVYVAAQKSSINRLADSNRLVKAGSRVVELKPTDEAIELEEEEDAAEADAAAEDKNAAESKDDQKAEGDTETSEEPSEQDVKLGIQGSKYAGILEELGDTYSVTEEGYTRTAGFVSYYVDGAEAKLSTKAIESLNYKDLKDLTGRKAVKVPSKNCGKDYPVFKIVRNRKWYLIYYLSKEDAAKYAAGETVYIKVNDENVPVTVRDVRDEGKKVRITLTCKTFFDGFLEIRNLDTKVTVESAEGLVLEDGSIVEAPDGRRGVFVINKLGEHVFTPVRTKADDGTKCVVYSDIYVDENGNYVETIGTYDEVIAEPSEEDIASLKKDTKETDETKETNETKEVKETNEANETNGSN